MIKQAIEDFLARNPQVDKRKLLMQMRLAITGKTVGPPLYESMEVLGVTECIKRIKKIMEVKTAIG